MIYVHILLTRRSICNLTNPVCKFQQIKQKMLGLFHFTVDSLMRGGKVCMCGCVCVVGGRCCCRCWEGHQGMQGLGQSRIYDSRVPSDTCISVVYVVNCEEHGRESWWKWNRRPNPPAGNQTHLVQDRFGRENVVQGLQRDVLKQIKAALKTGSVRLARVWSRKWAASLLTLWVVWFIHLVAGVLRSSRNSGSFQWS